MSFWDPLSVTIGVLVGIALENRCHVVKLLCEEAGSLFHRYFDDAEAKDLAWRRDRREWLLRNLSPERLREGQAERSQRGSEAAADATLDVYEEMIKKGLENILPVVPGSVRDKDSLVRLRAVPRIH